MKEQSLLEGNRSCKLTKEDKQIIAGIYSVIFFSLLFGWCLSGILK